MLEEAWDERSSKEAAGQRLLLSFYYCNQLPGHQSTSSLFPPLSRIFVSFTHYSPCLHLPVSRAWTRCLPRWTSTASRRYRARSGRNSCRSTYPPSPSMSLSTSLPLLSCQAAPLHPCLHAYLRAHASQQLMRTPVARDMTTQFHTSSVGAGICVPTLAVFFLVVHASVMVCPSH